MATVRMKQRRAGIQTDIDVGSPFQSRAYRKARRVAGSNARPQSYMPARPVCFHLRFADTGQIEVG